MRISVFLLLAASLTASASGPEVRWLETNHNFGAFDESMGQVHCQFKAVNTGDEPVVVLNARANCGCTRPEYSREPIAPGDTLVINVGYDPEGRPGRFNKFIRVDLNTTPSRHELEINGTVIGSANTLKSRFPFDLGPAKLRDKVIAFGEVFKGKTVGAYIQGYNASQEPIQPKVENVPPYMSVLIEPKVVPPGEQFVVSTTIATSRTDKWGILTDEFLLFPDKESTVSQPISTVVIVKEDFSGMSPHERIDAPVIKIAEQVVDFGRIEATSSKPVTRTFTITNEGRDPLIIRSVDSPDDAISIEYKKGQKIKKGKSLTVKVTVDPSRLEDRELMNSRITVTTNAPDEPSKIIRAVGELAK